MPTFTPDQLFYSLGYALAAWMAAQLVALIASSFMFVSRAAFAAAAAFSFFGLLPFILLPPLLNATGQPHTSIFGVTVYPVEFILIALACLFPALESNAKEIPSVTARFDSLTKAARLTPWTSYRQLGAPYVLVSLLASGTATLPTAILLSIIFEWSRGGQEGLGGYIQGMIMQRSISERIVAMLVIAACAGMLFAMAHALLRYARHRFAITHDDGDGMQRIPKTGDDRRWMIGIVFGALLYIAIWWSALSLQSHDALRMTPPRFFSLLIDALAGDTSRVDLAVLGDAIVRTLSLSVIASVVGVLCASAAAAVAHQSRALAMLIDGSAIVTQAVPIFVLIPLYLMLLHEPWAAAALVVVSVTFFQGYRLLIEHLRSAPKTWMELMEMGSDNRGGIRRFFSFYVPFFWHYGLAALLCIAPSGVVAALVADLFLGGINGIARYAAYQGRTDIFAAMLVINLALIMMLCFYLVARVSERRLDE